MTIPDDRTAYLPLADIASRTAHVRYWGVKRTRPVAEVYFRGRYWGKADIAFCGAHVRF